MVRCIPSVTTEGSGAVADPGGGHGAMPPIIRDFFSKVLLLQYYLFAFFSDLTPSGEGDTPTPPPRRLQRLDPRVVGARTRRLVPSQTKCLDPPLVWGDALQAVLAAHLSIR